MKHNHKIYTYLPWETLKGKKTQQNFLYIDVSKVQIQNHKYVLLILTYIYLFVSYALYTSECVLKWGTNLLYLYFIFHFNFSLTGHPQQSYWDEFT